MQFQDPKLIKNYFQSLILVFLKVRHAPFVVSFYYFFLAMFLFLVFLFPCHFFPFSFELLQVLCVMLSVWVQWVCHSYPKKCWRRMILFPKILLLCNLLLEVLLPIIYLVELLVELLGVDSNSNFANVYILLLKNIQIKIL